MGRPSLGLSEKSVLSLFLRLSLKTKMDFVILEPEVDVLVACEKVSPMTPSAGPCGASYSCGHAFLLLYIWIGS